MKKILVSIPLRDIHKIWLEEAGQGQCSYIYQTNPDIKTMQQASVIIGQPELQDIQQCPALEWIQMTFAGADKYTCSLGFPRKIQLTNASGGFGVIISEYVLAGILTLFRHFPAYRKQQENMIWQDCGGERTLEGSHVLILGVGDIGTNIAHRLKAFGAQVTGIRRTMQDNLPDFDQVFLPDTLDTVLSEADIVIGCLPNTPETKHLLHRERIFHMKKDALLVNVGRGSLIETDALVEALTQGHLAGAVLDVFETEPLPKNHPLWQLDNVLITPHISGPSHNHCPLTEDKIIKICCENIKRYLSGQPLLNKVDWETGYRKR